MKLIVLASLALMICGCRSSWTLKHGESLSFDRNCHCQEKGTP